jgi:hypothetical protein
MTNLLLQDQPYDSLRQGRIVKARRTISPIFDLPHSDTRLARRS